MTNGDETTGGMALDQNYTVTINREGVQRLVDKLVYTNGRNMVEFIASTKDKPKSIKELADIKIKDERGRRIANRGKKKNDRSKRS